MVNASEIANSLRDLLRTVPDLLADMGDDSERIFCYHDRYPANVNLSQAIHDMPSPGVMIVWQGRSLGSFGSLEVFKHRFSVIFRAGESSLQDDPPRGYYTMDKALWDGIPGGAGLPMKYQAVHASCHPMDPYSISRQTDAEGVDYWEAQISFTEVGDE